MITVIGSINLDLIANVGRLPAAGETVSGDNFITAPGGKGANQALAARRAGGETRMIGAVGHDAFAEEALALLESAGVELSAVHETHTATGTALILVAADGENVIAVVPGSNSTVRSGDVAAAELRKDDFILLQLELPLDTVAASLKSARETGAISMLNCAPFSAKAAQFLADADYVVANETEFDLYAQELTLVGDDREARMRALCEETGRVIIVTLGKDGVLAATPDDFLRLPGQKITPVDTVGAGDTFCGYLAAALDSKMSLEDALKRANAAAALACLKPGAQPSIPTVAEVDEAMKAEGATSGGRDDA